MSPYFLTLTGIYEPSAIQQLPDGRFLVVEDEKQHPFILVTINPDGSVGIAPLSTGLQEADDAFWKLDDLEGIALDRAGYIYTTTSHSRDADGDEKKSRDKLARFRIEGDRVVEAMVIKGLKSALVAAHPVLAAAAEIRDVKSAGGLNIEALEITPDQQRLLIGFRSPLLDNRAIIARVENLSEIFAGKPLLISASLETLDLGGNGIRGMSFIPSLDGLPRYQRPRLARKGSFPTLVLERSTGRAGTPCYRSRLARLRACRRETAGSGLALAHTN